MWPFTKPDNRPRILLVDAWRDDGALDLSVRRVSRIGEYFVMQRYSSSDEVFILLHDGKFRGKPKMTWEMIDEIPGLVTKASQAFAKSHPDIPNGAATLSDRSGT